MRQSSVWRYFDVWLAAAVIVLTAYGIVMIRSAVTGAPAFESLPQSQIIWAIAGIIAMFVIAGIDYRLIAAAQWYFYLGLILSLILVFLIGTINNSARRWFDLGLFQLQPSEFGRIVIVVTFAQFLTVRQRQMSQIGNTFAALMYIGIPIVLIFIEPDLGMSILYFVMWFVMIWMAGLPLLHFIILGGLGSATTAVMIPRLAEYQQARLLAFLRPEDFPEQAFNVDQAVIAIGSGGWLGKGYLNGTQSQLGFLRVQHTDFIFSVIVEEMGFWLGAIVVLGLMSFILWRILNVISITRDPVGRLACSGIAGVLFFQTVVSVGMNLRLLPVTGLTLPFVSYGGSSLITWFLTIGLVQSIRMRHRKQEFG
jgi:rod shape determining protein RodA